MKDGVDNGGFAVRWLPFTCGAVAVTLQSVSFRGFFVLCEGNELLTGFFYFTWLLIGAFGSLAGGWVAGRGGRLSVRMVFAILLALGLLFPLCPAVYYLVRPLMGWTPGETLSTAEAVGSCAAALVLPVFLLGACFPLAVAASRQHAGAAACAAPLIAVYGFEAVGAFVAGVLLSAVLMMGAGDFAVAFAAGLFCLAGTVVWVFGMTPFAPRANRLALAGTGVLCLGLVAAAAAGRFRPRVLAAAFPGYAVLHVADSAFGNGCVVRREEQVSLLYNGAPVASSDETEGAQEFAHFSLLQHPHPRRVLLIGGTAGGLPAALQQHGIEQLDLVELDRMLPELAARYLPAPDAPAVGGGMVTRYYEDGRAFLARSQARYDVILLHSPDPTTVQLARFFSLEFFRRVRAQLAPGGIVVITATGEDAFLSLELRRYLACLLQTLDQSFLRVSVIPGFTFQFVATDDPLLPLGDPEAINRVLAGRSLNSPVVNANYVLARVDPVRRDEFLVQLRATPGRRASSDLYPVIQKHATAFQEKRFARVSTGWSRGVRTLASPWLLGGLSLLFAGGLAWRPRRRLLHTAVAVNGVNGIALFALGLLSFQAVFGYVYVLCGLLTAMFMAGLALAAWFLARRERELILARLVVGMQVLLALLFLLVPLATWAGVSGRASGTSLLVITGYALFAATAGAAGGSQFLALSALVQAGEQAPERNVGRLYGLDLIGGCLGALLVLPVLLPALGFLGTGLVLAAVNAGVSVLLAWRGRT